MTLDVEGVVDGGARRKKSLGRPGTPLCLTTAPNAICLDFSAGGDGLRIASP